MIIYNMADDKIINLKNATEIKIRPAPHCIDVVAYFPSDEYSTIISLVASSKEEREQLKEDAKNIIKNIYDAMSQNKCLIIAEEDDYIGLTD